MGVLLILIFVREEEDADAAHVTIMQFTIDPNKFNPREASGGSDIGPPHRLPDLLLCSPCGRFILQVVYYEEREGLTLNFMSVV